MRYANLLAEDYYNWLLDFIEDEEHDWSTYSSLLDRLFTREFYDIIENDDNRVSDGLNLRNRFADEIGEHLYFVLDDLPDYCTVLEMMIALAIRIEDNIMYDPDKGDQTSKWFWIMVRNLGLEDCTDENFYEREVDDILDRFLERQYDYYGNGNIFTVNNPRNDMRKVEIWYQANYFFSEYLNVH